MFNWQLLQRVLWGPQPKLPDVKQDRYEELCPEGLTMGSLIIGRQGIGKTTALSRMIVENFVNYPDRAIFILDWSGSNSDNILEQILRREDYEQLLERVVYDELGHPDWVIPMPEFYPGYGHFEEQVQRVSDNLSKLAPALVQDAPFLAGLGLREIAPQIMRLLTAISDAQGEAWQVTETKKLIVDPALMKKALKDYGHKVPEAKWFLERVFLQLSPKERELRSYAILALLGAIEPREARARVGYSRPGWTPREAIQKGQLVMVDGSNLINKRNTQHYLFTQAYSIIMAEINNRQPGNPDDQPVSLVMDEVYSLLSIPGMAEEVGMLAPLYRSRKLQPYVVLQALSQLAPNLRQQIWSIGNVMCFAISNFDEAYQLGQQMFRYEPRTVKLPAKTETQNPIIETDRGQYLDIANKIQRMKHRECIIRRYISEQVLDEHVRYVPRTKGIPQTPLHMSVQACKEMLLRARGVRVRDALDVIVNRNLTTKRQGPPQI